MYTPVNLSFTIQKSGLGSQNYIGCFLDVEWYETTSQKDTPTQSEQTEQDLQQTFCFGTVNSKAIQGQDALTCFYECQPPPLSSEAPRNINTKRNSIRKHSLNPTSCIPCINKGDPVRNIFNFTIAGATFCEAATKRQLSFRVSGLCSYFITQYTTFPHRLTKEKLILI